VKNILISVGQLKLKAELNESKTAKAIWQALPIESKVNLWGEEIYFSIPVPLDEEKHAKAIVNLGDLGYWPPGKAFCIFFGQTPASTPEGIRPAGPVNVFGKLINRDFKKLKKILNNSRIKIEKIKP